MSALTAPPLKASRPIQSKTEPLNGHKGILLSDGTQLVNMRMAICQALYEEMKRDPNIFIMGEEVAQYNGAYKVTMVCSMSSAPNASSIRRSPNPASLVWPLARR